MELSNTDTTLKITENNKEDIMEKETSIEPVTTKIKSLKLKLKGPKTKLRIKSNIPTVTEDNMESVYNENFSKINLDELNGLDDVNYNTYLYGKELLNSKQIENSSNRFENLYPSLDDDNFNVKIAEKKEFHETIYDGKQYNIEDQAEKLCNADFEVSPHQLFVRNFLSFQTPYNSLLLYHGLGTGKTCSAITVAEEMRNYLKQLGFNQRIIVVASPNVQENFKLQLFDERKLKLIDGLWNLRACTGNKYLKEINPMNMKGLNKEKVVKQIKRIINTSYLFLGYTEFSNYIDRISFSDNEDPKKRKAEMIRKLKRNFNNRLVIIDEVHNIRVSEDKKDKRVAQELFKLVKYADNLRLLFLSATPMYNSYKEVIWLLNIMNLNDNRSIIEHRDVFDKEGNLLISADGKNIGEELLKRKATGYVSFVRGENPYTFPYRIFPSLFSAENTFKNIPYPRIQINGKPIIQPLEHLDVYVNKCGLYQEIGYNYITKQINDKSKKNKDGLPSFENMDSFGYTILQKPLQALNIVYPYKKLDDISPNFDSKLLIGSEGLKRIMKYTETTNPPSRKNFEYKSSDYEGMFLPNNIGNYSSKIKGIIDNIYNSTGIILIYSQFIDGGAVPIALALESIGFSRFGTKTANLFKTAPRKQIDANTYVTKEEMSDPSLFRPATYTMITGDPALSPDKVYDLKNLTDEDNKNGEKIKVVIISMTGAEGIDFKNLRQVHILEPWYNLSLIEQIIGRAVRTCSHKQLPFKERNVEIFLYGTLMNDSEEESVDLYIYRLAELKAVQIGRVSRILKETSVDCILNIDQTNFTEENMNTVVKQVLSNKKTIDFPVGDKSHTVSCDYMDTCNFKCKPFKQLTNADIKLDTYEESFIVINTDKIIQRIKELFKEHHFYKKDKLISELNVLKNYPLIQINTALSTLINDKNEYIVDKYDRIGYLVNIDQYYLFQPVELNDDTVSVFERNRPIDFKHKDITIPVKLVGEPIKLQLSKHRGEKNMNKKTNGSEINIVRNIIANYNNATNKEVVDIKRGEDNWYLYAAYLKNKHYFKDNFNVNDDDYVNFIIDHNLESLLFRETKDLLNYIYNKDEMSEIEKLVKNYYDNRILKSKGVIGILLVKDNKPSLLIYENNEWKNALSEDYTDLATELKKMVIDINNMNTYVGFIGDFKNEYNIFKVKNMKDKRSKGARCDQSGKSDTIKLLNSILDETRYTNENTKGRNKTEFCIIQEMVLRDFDKKKKNGKRWFLKTDESIINNIEKMSF